MLKIILLLVVLVGSLFLLSGCGSWGHWGGHGHGHNHSSHNDTTHSHYRVCGHSGH